MSALTELAGVRAEMARLDRETRAAWARYEGAKGALAAAERAAAGPGGMPREIATALQRHRDTLLAAWHEVSGAECAYLRSIAPRRAGSSAVPAEPSRAARTINRTTASSPEEPEE